MRRDAVKGVGHPLVTEQQGRAAAPMQAEIGALLKDKLRLQYQPLVPLLVAGIQYEA